MPGYLSGVFYLRVPGDMSVGGTELYDPRGPAERSPRSVEVLPMNLTWLIFPSWMDHRSARVDSDEERYVIAADSYIKVS